jgi:hypothetical protein
MVAGSDMDLLIKLVVVGVLVWIAWVVFTPRYVFVVRVRGGVARTTRGKVTSAFLDEIGLGFADAGVADGWVGGVRRGRRVLLSFSPRLPPPLRQRLRNLWLLHG